MRFYTAISLAAAVAGTSATVLYPIHVRTAESAFGLERRADEGTNWRNMEPAQEASLLYGSPVEDDQMLLANMTIKAPDGLPIVMMERLEGLTKAVDCSAEGDNELSVTWNDEEAYQNALKSWAWVNEDADQQFVLIVNHEGCGEEDQRNAFKITDVDTDEASLVTKLTAVLTPWKEITGTYSMNFGKAVLKPGAQKKLRARGFGDFFSDVGNAIKDGAENAVDKVGEVAGDVKEGAEQAVDKVEEVAGDVKEGAEKAVDKVEEVAGDAVDGVKEVAGDAIDNVKEGLDKAQKGIQDVFEEVGDADIEKAVEFSVAGGTPNEKKNIFTDPFKPPRIILDCANCFITGKFKMIGSLKVDNFKIQELSISMAPSGFSATAEIDTVLSTVLSPAAINDLTKVGADKKKDLVTLEEKVDLIEIPVPGAGVVIPQIFSLGLIASVEAGFALSFKGKLGFTTGLTVSLPDSALINLNLADLPSSSSTGFEGTSAEPKFVVNNASATVDGSVFFRPKFALKAEVTSVGELSADIALGLPQINANATVEFNQNGVCPDSTEKTGVKFKLGGVLNLVVGASGEILGQGGRLIEKVLAQVNLFTPLEKCFPFDIALLDDVAPSSTVSVEAPAATATAAEGDQPVRRRSPRRVIRRIITTN